MIELGGIQLNPHMHWVDEFEDNYSVIQTAQRTIGGAMVISSKQLYSGRPITLVAVQDQGWLTKDQVMAVSELAKQAGASFQLTIGSRLFQVVFRHHEPPAFIAEPLNNPGAEAAPGYYTATIKLMTI